MKTKRTKHSVYNLNYHIVLVSKYRHKVFLGAIETYVKSKLQEVCDSYEWELISHEVMPEHIHVFVSASPKVAPLTIASTLKSIVAREVFKTFPTLKAKRFWGSGLFSDGCYYGSVGTVSVNTIKKYIAEQKLT
jgi:putative transposase